MEAEKTLYQSQDLRLAYGSFERPDLTKQRLHMHHHCEILFFFRVKGIFHVEGSTYRVQAGDLILIQPLEAHHMQSDPDSAYDRLVLQFSPELFRSMDPERTILRPFFDRASGERNLYRPPSSLQKGWYSYIQSMLNDSSRNNILIALLNLMQQLQLCFQEQSPDLKKETLEHRIIQFINGHLHENFTTQALCDRFYISRTQLYQRFITATGVSVGKYIAARRMLLARHLIAQGGKPTEIYTQCGFRDYSTFYRAYKKHFGCNPTEEAGGNVTVSIDR